MVGTDRRTDAARRPWSESVEDHDRSRHRRKRPAQTIDREHDARPRILEHHRNSIAGVGRVERHVGAPGLQYSEESHHCFERAIDEHPDRLIAADAECDEFVRHAVCAFVQFAIGQGLVAIDEGHGVGCAVNLSFDAFMHTPRRRHLNRGLVERRERALVPGRQAWQLRQRGPGAPGHRVEQPLHQARHATRKVHVEAASVERKAARNGRLEHRLQGEGEVGPIVQGDLQVGKRAQVLQARVAVRLVDDDDGVEEPGAAGDIGTRRRLDERGLLERANCILPFIEIAQQSQQEPIARHPRANRNGIDQQPDDPLGAGNRRVPAGPYLAEHDIVLAGECADDHCPGGMDERRQAEAVCLAQSGEGRRRSRG